MELFEELPGTARAGELGGVGGGEPDCAVALVAPVEVEGPDVGVGSCARWAQ